MAATQQAIITPDSFKGDFTTAKLLGRLSERILDQHDARTAAAAASTARSNAKQTQILSYDSLVAVDQLLMHFERADKELQNLRRELDGRVLALGEQVGAAEEAFQEQARDFEESVEALTDGFNSLDERMTSVTSIATKFGDRLQSTDNYRRNAEEAIRIIQALQEFANAEDLSELSEMYHDDAQLSHAAALTRTILDLAAEVTRANERVGAQASAANGASKLGAEKGTIEYARQMLEQYRNRLESRVVHRFDRAEARRDLTDMATAARIMQEFERSGTGTGLVQRYISTRGMFVDPKELALGHSQPVVDTNTALAAKRRLGTLYKSIAGAVRHEAATMQAVFARPHEALTMFVHRLFEQRIQTVLSQMLATPPPDASKEMLEAYLKLLSEAYQSTCNLAKTIQELVGDGADVMELVETAFSGVLEQYAGMELKLLRLHYDSMPQMGPRGVLLQDPVIQYFKWNQEALDRATALCPDPAQRAEVVRCTVHNSSTAEGDVGCLLEQVAIHLTKGLDGALQQCMRRTGSQYGSANLPNLHRATVRQAALRVAEQGIGQVLGAISQAGAIVKMLQAHFAAKVAPLLEEVPHTAQLCSHGFATMLRATEDHSMATLEAAIADLFQMATQVLTTEQKRLDFRPSDELPAPLDQPTDACALVSALLAAVLQEGSQTLQASNLVSFQTEIGVRTLAMLERHMTHFSFSPTGALRWKRDVTEYGEALRPAAAASAVVRAKAEELASVINILLVAPESLSSLVDGSLRLAHGQAIQYVRMREDFKTARVQGKTLAVLFAAA